VKELLKSDSICESYAQMKKGPVIFDSQCSISITVCEFISMFSLYYVQAEPQFWSSNVCVKEASERVMSHHAVNSDILTADELSKMMQRQADQLQHLHAHNDQLRVSPVDSFVSVV